MLREDNNLEVMSSSESLQNFLRAIGYTPGDGSNYHPGSNYKEDNDFYIKMLLAARAIMASGTAEEQEKIKRDLLQQLVLARYLRVQEQIIMVLCEGSSFSEQPISIDYVQPLISSAVSNALQAQTLVYIQFLPFLVFPGVDAIINPSIAEKLMLSNHSRPVELAVDLLRPERLNVEIQTRLAHGLGMIRMHSLYERLLGLLINEPPRYDKLEAFVGRYIALALSTFSAPSDQELCKIEKYMRRESQSISRLVQWAMIDVLGQRGIKGSYVAVGALRRLAQDSHVHVLVQWHILLVLYDLVSKEEFEQLADSLQNSLSRYIDNMDERFKQQLQLVNQGIIAMKSGATNRFAQRQIDEIKERLDALLPKKSLVLTSVGETEKEAALSSREQYERLEDLIFRLDTVGHLYGKMGDERLRQPEEQDPVEAALEELLTTCSNQKICDHIHHNLQKINRRIRGLKIKQ